MPLPADEARIAGPVALEAGAAGPEIFAGRAGQKAAEAEAAIVERDRPIGIAFAGGDRISHARDQKVSHRDLGDHALRGSVRQADVDGRDGGVAVAHADADFVVAAGGGLTGLGFAVVETPGAERAGRHRTGDAMAVIG